MIGLHQQRPPNHARPDRRRLLELLGRFAAAIAGLAGCSSTSAAADRASAAVSVNEVRSDQPDWRDANVRARKLAQRARQARGALEAKIGPRGLTIGYLVLPHGRKFPVHAVSPAAAKKIMRSAHLGPEHYEARAAAVAAVRTACEQWDVEAERAGVTRLQRQSEAAHKQIAAHFARATDGRRARRG